LTAIDLGSKFLDGWQRLLNMKVDEQKKHLRYYEDIFKAVFILANNT